MFFLALKHKLVDQVHVFAMFGIIAKFNKLPCISSLGFCDYYPQGNCFKDSLALIVSFLI